MDQRISKDVNWNMEGNNVFILGAGFSKGCGHPLMKDFIDMGASAIERSNDDNAKNVCNRLKNLRLAIFRGQIESSYNEKEHDLSNIEDLLNAVVPDSQSDLPSQNQVDHKFSPNDVRDFIVTSLKYTEKKPSPEAFRPIANKDYNAIYRRMLKEPQQPSTNPFPDDDDQVFLSYPELFLLIALADTNPDNPDIIISFNYDLVIERIATNERPGVFKIHYPQRGKDGTLGQGPVTINLVKPNGSGNWLFCETCLNISVQADYVISGQKCPKCGGSVTCPYIQPPGAKAYPLNSQHELSIENIISKAKRIGFFGYSFPKADGEFLDQFKNGLNLSSELRIYVFNPENRLCKSNTSHFSTLNNNVTINNYIVWNPMEENGRPVYKRNEHPNLYKTESLFGMRDKEFLAKVAGLFGKWKFKNLRG